MNYTDPVPEAHRVEQVLFESRGEAQHLLLERDAAGVLSLTIDGHWQFSSKDEAIFHEMLADLPMVFAPRIEKVLILGGGDALALRNVLRYPGVREVSLCEFDDAVLEMVRSVPEMHELSEGALDDPRVRVHLGDAWDFVATRSSRPDPSSFDVVICDFPACTDAKLERLFSREFYARLAKLMHPQSVLSVQVSQDPAGFWRVVDGAIAPNFEWTWPSLVALGDPTDADVDWADFVMAGAVPHHPQRQLRAVDDRLLSDATIETHRIQNHDDAGFRTGAYGDEPTFDAPW